MYSSFFWRYLAGDRVLSNSLHVYEQSAPTNRLSHGYSLATTLTSNAGELPERPAERFWSLLCQFRFRHAAQRLSNCRCLSFCGLCHFEDSEWLHASRIQPVFTGIGNSLAGNYHPNLCHDYRPAPVRYAVCLDTPFCGLRYSSIRPCAGNVYQRYSTRIARVHVAGWCQPFQDFTQSGASFITASTGHGNHL